jgi:hypothetical protein
MPFISPSTFDQELPVIKSPHALDAEINRLDLLIESIVDELRESPLDIETRRERLAERGRLARTRRHLLARKCNARSALLN